MYRQFCKNLDNFIKINQSDKGDYRLIIAKELKDLTDPNLYQEFKKTKESRYMHISTFLYRVHSYKDKYPSVKKFLWELWGYGFDAIKFNNVDLEPEEKIKEKIKLIDLLLGTHYWA